MTDLAHETCRPCDKESPPLPEAEVRALSRQLPGWTIERPGGEAPRLTKTFDFPGFRQAVEFAVLLAERADQANHHPTVTLELREGGVAVVSWWTHHMGALNRNDFIMAAKTEDIYASGAWRVFPATPAAP